jgi:hypothetical protein
MTECIRYLGDGVYASHDGYQVWLTTGVDGQRHSIALEPAVLRALADFEAAICRGDVPATDRPR